MRHGLTPYLLWRRDPSEFERYQATQSRDGLFPVGGFIASFVVDPLKHHLFVGLYSVLDVWRNTEPLGFEYLGSISEPGTENQYDLRRDDRFREYEGRLVIAWGDGTRAWVQRADLRDKPILEIRRDDRDVDWPGYMGVLIEERDVPTLAPNWAAKLAAANGIYLLVCSETGEQYVGAAFGPGGFLSRWRDYAVNGHGGNKLLMERRHRTSAPFQISILEVFGSTITEDETYAAETRWKRALGSRAHGLNAN